MGIRSSRSTAVAALLLATIAFASLVAGSHRHDSLHLSTAHGDLPTFSAGHEQPDRTIHIEGATRIESAPCVGCLQRLRQRADGPLELVLGGFEPSSVALTEESTWLVATDAGRLPASRAPPRA